MEGHLWRGLEDRLPTEQKANWAEYTAFSNTLQTKGFSLLEGPLEGTPDVLLILLAENAEETRSRFAADCWHRNYLLRIAQIVL